MAVADYLKCIDLFEMLSVIIPVGMRGSSETLYEKIALFSLFRQARNAKHARHTKHARYASKYL